MAPPLKVVAVAMMFLACATAYSASFAKIRRPPLARSYMPEFAAFKQTRAGAAPPSGPPSGSKTIVVDGKVLAGEGQVPPIVADALRPLTSAAAGAGKVVFIYANNSDTNISTGGPDVAFQNEIRDVLASVLKQGEEIKAELWAIQQRLPLTAAA